MSIEGFIDYLRLEKNYSPHTVNAYVRDIREFSEFSRLESDLQDPDLAEYLDIRNWMVALAGRDLNNRSINRKLSSLKAYFRFLVKIGRISRHPMQKFKALKTSREVQIPFSEYEMQQIAEGLPFENSFEGLRDRLVIELFYTTGIRRAELIGLKCADVDLDRATLKVLGKRNKERILPLLPATITLIRAYMDARSTLETGSENAYFFLSGSGNKMYETLVYRIINGYFSKVSSKTKKSPHILRHTFATHLLNKGADLNSVKELLGHTSLAATQVYTHNSIAELRKIHAKAHPRSEE